MRAQREEFSRGAKAFLQAHAQCAAGAARVCPRLRTHWPRVACRGPLPSGPLTPTIPFYSQARQRVRSSTGVQ
eukprot:2669128-Pleurochrysis_carterae.AAC.1